jgi:hypothetical protein
VSTGTAIAYLSAVPDQPGRIFISRSQKRGVLEPFGSNQTKIAAGEILATASQSATASNARFQLFLQTKEVGSDGCHGPGTALVWSYKAWI